MLTLQSYPFPAAVFSLAHRPDQRSTPVGYDTDDNIRNDTYSALTSTLTEEHDIGHHIEWSNEKWRRLLSESELRENIAAEAFQTWVASDGEEVFTLELSQASITVHLVKATVSNVCVVTSVCLEATACAKTSSPTSTPLPTPSTLSRRSSTVSEIYPDMPPLTPPLTLPGFVTTDCYLLLEHTDWARTALGPRSKWSPVVETMIAVMMASATQDSLWLGRDFQMI